MAPQKYACPSCYVLKYARRIVEAAADLLQSNEPNINDLETCIKRLHGLTTKEDETAAKAGHQEETTYDEPKTEFDKAMHKGRIYDDYEGIAFNVLGVDHNTFFGKMMSLKEDLEKKMVGLKAEYKT